jgi:hypothetical protein
MNIQVRVLAGGLQGIQGFGYQQNQGIQGAQGLAGQYAGQGDIGLQGIQGFGYEQNQGVQGIQGHQGVQGVQGHQGVQGVQGVQGLQGLSVAWQNNWSNYTISFLPNDYLLNDIVFYRGASYICITPHTSTNDLTATGYPDQSANWNLVVSQGVQGIQGQQGTQGFDGIQGAQGLVGIQGYGWAQQRGIQGTQGVQGRDGQFVAQGIQGPTGRAGGDVIKTYNILNDFTAPITGSQIFVPASNTSITKLQITNGEPAKVDITLGLYKNNNLLTYITLSSGLISYMLTGLNFSISINDYITVNVIAGYGKNMSLTLLNT